LRRKEKRPHVIVVLPPGRAGRILDRNLRRWVSRGRVNYVPPASEILFDVLSLIGHSAEGEGLAALHFWGQAGEPSAAWIAAADPVHLEVHLDYLCLHALNGGQMPLADLRKIVDLLQERIGSENLAFARLGNQLYLRGDNEIASATVSAQFVDGLPPGEFMPEGQGADSLDLLISEAQMALHEHEINMDREHRGQRAINSLWVWGGGKSPPVSSRPIPPLYTDDPLFRGFWYSRSGTVRRWSDDFDACFEHEHSVLVAVAPDRDEEGQLVPPDGYLQILRQLMKRKKPGHLTLLFRDGLRIELRTADAKRFWRQESSLVSPQ